MERKPKVKQLYRIEIELENGVVLRIERRYVSLKQANAIARRQGKYHARQWETRWETIHTELMNAEEVKKYEQSNEG